MVHVGNPHVERHSAHFERETRHDEDQAEHQHLVANLAGIDGLEHLTDVQRARGAVEHRHAIQQETTGHRAQHEILHRRLDRAFVVTAQCHQGIARQRQQFQSEVDHQEVVRGDHDEHAEQREDGQREQLSPALQHAAVGRVGATIDQRDHHGHCSETLQPVAHGIGDHHVAPAIEGVAAGGVHALQHRHHAHGQQGQNIGCGTAGAGHPQIHQGNHTAHDQKNDLGVDRQPADVVNHL